MDWRTKAGLVAGAAACLLIGAFPFVWGREVPLLDAFDLGMHELGHLLARPLGAFIHTLAGSVVQIAVPLGLAGYFLLRRHEFAGAGLCLAWAGTSAYDVAVYVADAPFERLQLIGGYHDWAFLLGRLEALGAADIIAGVVRGAGLVAVLGGAAVCLYPLVHAWVQADGREARVA